VTPPPPLPSPTLTLAPASAPRRRLVHLAAAAPHHHHHHRRRRVYRRQRAAPTQTRAPRRTLSASNAARGEEDLEEAIYEFMRRSDLAQGAVWASSREAEASPSGRQPETEEEETETKFGTGLDGMLTRLQRERERVRPPLPRSSDGAGGERDNVALMGQSGAPSHSATGGRYTPKVPDNGNIHSYHPQNGALEHNKSSKSLTNDAWRTWSLDKGGFSDFQGHMTNFLPYCIPFV
jgi:hypothetical protein